MGLVFAFANAVSASMNTIGFCNSLSDLLKLYDYQMFDGGVNDARVVGNLNNFNEYTSIFTEFC